MSPAPSDEPFLTGPSTGEVMGAVRQLRAVVPKREMTLFEEHGRYVAAIAKRILGHDDDVDDVVQDVFIAAHRGIHALEDPGAVKGWLAAVTVRTARRALRARKTWSFFGFSGDEAYEDIASPDASPHERALVAKVYEVLDGLPTDERLAWSLRYLAGEKLETVAELCGFSLATAKRKIAAAQIVMAEAMR